MTQQQAVRIACRLFAVYLLFWVVTDIINLPSEIVSLRYEWLKWSYPREGMPANLESSVVYYFRLAIMAIAANILRIAAWSALALWFYQCPPLIQRFFGVSDPVESPQAPPTPSPEAEPTA